MSRPTSTIVPSAMAMSACSTLSDLTTDPPRTMRSNCPMPMATGHCRSVQPCTAVRSNELAVFLASAPSILVEMIEQVIDHFDRDRDILDVDRLGWIVADPLCATDEEHRHRRQRMQRHRVMTGATRQPLNREPSGLDRFRQQPGQPEIARDRISLLNDVPFEAHVAAHCDLAGLLPEPGPRRFSHLVVDVANIEAERDCAGNDIARPGFNGDFTDRGHQTGHRTRSRLRRQNELG